MTTTTTTTPAAAPDTGQTLLEFGHAVLAVLHDFTHLPAIHAVQVVDRPRYAWITPGDPYSFTAVHNLAVWAKALGEPVRFRGGTLPQIEFRTTLGGLPVEFNAGLYQSRIGELGQRTATDLGDAHTFTADELVAALADHPDVAGR